MCVCVCVCVCVLVLYINTHVQIHTYIHHINTCIYIYIYRIYMDIDIYLCTEIHSGSHVKQNPVCVCVCVCVCVFVQRKPMYIYIPRACQVPSYRPRTQGQQKVHGNLAGKQIPSPSSSCRRRAALLVHCGPVVVCGVPHPRA
jgi:hypothetical protein